MNYGNAQIPLSCFDNEPCSKYKITAQIFYENIVVDDCPYVDDESITFVLAEDVIDEDGTIRHNIVTTELTNQQIKNIGWKLFK